MRPGEGRESVQATCSRASACSVHRFSQLPQVRVDGRTVRNQSKQDARGKKRKSNTVEECVGGAGEWACRRVRNLMERVGGERLAHVHARTHTEGNEGGRREKWRRGWPREAVMQRQQDAENDRGQGSEEGDLSHTQDAEEEEEEGEGEGVGSDGKTEEKPRTAVARVSRGSQDQRPR